MLQLVTGKKDNTFLPSQKYIDQTYLIKHRPNLPPWVTDNTFNQIKIFNEQEV